MRREFQSKSPPTGKPIQNNGPQRPPKGNQRIPKPPVEGKLPDEVPGELIEVSSAVKIPRDGNTITAAGCASVVSFCIKNGVPKEMSLSEAARRLSLHRHSVRAILTRFQRGEVGAISINEDMSFEDFEEMIADDLIASYYTRQEMLEAIDNELQKRITDTPEELSTRDILSIKKLENQITMNTVDFLGQKRERDERPKNNNEPVTDSALSELKNIFSNASKRIQIAEEKNLIIDND